MTIKSATQLRSILRKHRSPDVDSLEPHSNDWWYIDDEDLVEEMLATCYLFGCTTEHYNRVGDDTMWVDAPVKPGHETITVMYREGAEGDLNNEYHVWQINLARYEQL